jgi:transposase
MASTWQSCNRVRLARSRHLVEQFAELVAEGESLRSAAKAIGVGWSTAQGYWKRIRADLGSQADG